MRSVALVAALALVAGCGGDLFESKILPPSVYVLHPAETAPESKVDADLVIDRPSLRPGLDTARIAVEYPDRRLDYFANAGWSGDAGDILLSFAVRSFQISSGLHSVVSESTRFDAPYRLEMVVNDFTARYESGRSAPVVIVAIRARLGRNGRPLPGGEIGTRIERPAESNRLTAVVEAYEGASQAAMAELIAATRQAIAGDTAAEKSK